VKDYLVLYVFWILAVLTLQSFQSHFICNYIIFVRGIYLCYFSMSWVQLNEIRHIVTSSVVT